ncbi:MULTISPECIES: MupG family TIM beta-alpha barrel fold protein [Lactobacillus]|uniref:DUF871 domain-containing protein n=1 Tax=Lactobacillus xujianguonis TaxID=2495899 RepID=A0A437SVC2_9LACO|nr:MULTISPECIES: MupG family TIM beta-alpha barrel fold protein [Lactobacillus]RVU70787.1 DUF871 domain-containing protein [Lactobacillus xujianguonis]RVU73950.1 DUF871 domain-containing protein [Lactobacillus xujianguonis]
MLGISIYFQDYDPNYLKTAAKAGAKYIFTSLQIPEEDYSHLDEVLPDFLALCHKLGMQLVPDVSPVTFKRLGVKPNDYGKLKALGFTALRLDYGADDFALIKQLQKDFFLMLNASVVNDDYLRQARASGVDFDKIALTYNFYPETNTGMSWTAFKERNLSLKAQGLRTQAFVCGDALKRFPLYEGLPTVEADRGKNPYVAAVQMIHEAHVDDVFIGDSEARSETLIRIADYQKDKLVHLPCHLEAGYENLYGQKIKLRADQPEKIVRLLLPRKPDVPIFHNLTPTAGSIVMQNRLARRYSGEVYLVKETLPVAARTNVIGFIAPEYQELLQYLDADNTIVFDRL